MAGVEDVLVEILERGLPKSEAQRHLLIDVVRGKAKLPSQGGQGGQEPEQEQQQERPTTRSSSR